VGDQILDLLRDRDRLLGENRELHARVEALEAFSLREGKDGRTLLMYEHADGEACVVAELTCPAVAEVASVLWPTTEPEWSGGTMSDAIEENTGD
jgi:hypothetical protein